VNWIAGSTADLSDVNGDEGVTMDDRSVMMCVAKVKVK
jgi:hypothetical protein